MDILIILSGFIFACLVALIYEYKILQLRKILKNKVKFYVTCEKFSYNKKHYVYTLWIGKPYKIIGLNTYYIATSKSSMIALDVTFHVFGLNINDFADMKEGDIREVFLNIEN